MIEIGEIDSKSRYGIVEGDVCYDKNVFAPRLILITKTIILFFPLIKRNGKIKASRYHRGIPLSIPPEVIKRPGKIRLLNRIEKTIIAS